MITDRSRRLACALVCACVLAGCSGGGGGSTLPNAAAERSRPASADPTPTPGPAGAPGAAPGTLPTPPPMPTAAPAGTVPLHVKTYAYYIGIEPASLTASWMAAHATFVEAGQSQVRAFKSAGGQYGIAYTDPNFVNPANHEPLYTVPESGWFHDATGARVTKNTGQNVLIPSDPNAQAAYRSLTAGFSAYGYDFVRADDVYFDTLGAFWTAPRPGVEITTDTDYQAAESSMLAQSALPVIASGFGNLDGVQGTGRPAQTMVYLNKPNVYGGFLGDGCLQMIYAMSEPDWRSHQNTLLGITGSGKYAICHGMATTAVDSTVPRMFYLASWWLTYDPTWSVALPNFGNAGNLFVFPEYEIVPTNPVTSASTDVATLKSSTGAYVREFAACYQAGTLIGNCAAVSNPTGATVSLPPLSYTRSLRIDPNNTLNGGQATWVAGVSATLAPQTGVILLR